MSDDFEKDIIIEDVELPEHEHSHHHSEGEHHSHHHHHSHHRRHHRRHKRHEKAKKIIKAFLLIILFIVVAAGIFVAVKGRTYYDAAKMMTSKAEELKSGLTDAVTNIKKGDYDAADAAIAKVDRLSEEMKVELNDGKWEIIDRVPKVGEDIFTAKKLLNVVDEASETLLKPAVKYLRNKGLPDKSNLSADKVFTEEFCDTLDQFADLIDLLCPAAEKVIKDFNEVPEFNIKKVEAKVSKYRKFAKNNENEIYAHLKFLEQTSSTLLRTASKELRIEDPSIGNVDLSENLGPDLAEKLVVYANLIDKLMPAAEKTLDSFNELPEFKDKDFESKLSNIRTLLKSDDIQDLKDIVKQAPAELLRPAAEVMNKTPFEKLKTDDGLDTRVIKAYLDLAEKTKPYIVSACSKLIMSDFLNSHPKLAEKINTKLNAALPLIVEFDEYKPLVDVLLGDGKDKTYLIAAMNTAEIRACGGFPGSIGTVSVKGGILRFGEFSGVLQNIQHKSPATIAATEDEEALFVKSWFGTRMTGATTNPHFPRAAEILAAGYKLKKNVNVDGVIAMTPHILSKLIAITEPVKLSNGKKLDENYSMKYLQRDIYFQYFKGATTSSTRAAADAKTDAIFAEAADKTIKNVIEKIDIKTIKSFFDVIKKANEGRVFMLWMADEKAEKVVKDLGYSGSLNFDEKKPEIGVFYNIYDSNKLGFYADLDVSYGDEMPNPDGSVTYTVTVKLKNSIDRTSQKEGEGNGYLTSRYGGSTMRSIIYFFAPAGGKITEFKTSRKDVKGKSAEYQGLKLYYCPKFNLDARRAVKFTYKVTTAPGVEEKPTIVKTPVLTDYRDAKEPK